MIEGDNRYDVNDVNDVTALLDAITTPLTHLTPGSLCHIGGRDLLGVAVRLEHAARLLYAAQLVITDEIQAQGLAQTMGSPSTAALLGEHLLIPRGQAKARIAAATATLSQDSMTGGELDPVLPELSAAIRDGLINPDQVRSIVDTMYALPSSVNNETRDLAEHLMVEAAAVTPPAPFARFCRQIAAQLDQDGELPADHARDNMTLTLGRRNTRTGLTPLTGQLDDLTVEMLNKALDGLSVPRPTTDCGPDPRPGPIRRGQAFSEMLSRYLNLGDAPTDHGVRPHVSVILNLDDLRTAYDQACAADAAARARAGAATVGAESDLGTDTPSDGTPTTGAATQDGTETESKRSHSLRRTAATGAVYDSGTPLSATMLRQLLCDAAVLPVVLGGDGEVLDVGRDRRTFTPAIRKALNVRDRGCTFPGCDRPASWCDGHHVDTWAAMFGRTSVDNGALLCQYHHTEIHRGDWQMRMNAGRPEFLPPIWIDPEQKWLRNNLHHLAPPAITTDPHQPTGTD